MAKKDWPPLIAAGDLNGFPGAPFTEAVARAAADQVRGACGWHIAPSFEETVTLDHDGSRVLHLPSLYVTDVASVRDMTGRDPRDLTGWRWSEAGMIEGHFPRGFRAVEVTFTHGHDVIPDGLLPVLADRAQRRVRQQTEGPFSITYATDSDEGSPYAEALAAYKIPTRP